MIQKNNPDIQFQSHDIRNYVGAAISHAKLLTENSPKLENEMNITALVKNLEQVLLLTEKVSLSCPLTSINDGKMNQPSLETKTNIRKIMTKMI